MTHLIQQLPEPVLLLGDFNAKHIIWGNPDIDHRGTVLEQILLTQNITALNTGSPTHFHIQNATHSAIDISFVTSRCSADFRWSVLNDLHGSDHYPIVINSIDDNIVERPKNYICSKANWELFRELTVFDEETENNDINQLCQIFNSKLINAADSSIARSKGNPIGLRMPWWTQRCSDALRERKRTLRRYQRTKSIPDKIQYKKAKAKARYILKQTRKNSWKNYVSSLNRKTPMHKIWERVKKMKGKHKNYKTPYISTNDGIVTDSVSVANLLAEHYAMVSSRENYEPQFQRIKIQSERLRLDFNENDNDDSYNAPITMRELLDALKGCKRTAPGEDMITYDMIKNCDDSARRFLLTIYNKMWDESVYPDCWRHAIVLSFLKPDKPADDCKSYRPIALTSCAGKLMEKIINVRLMHYLESNHVLSDCQYGFRKQRSTVDALVRFTNDIHTAFAERKYLLCVFFDISKAYDTAWRYMILKTMYESGINGHMAKYIENFLRERTFYTRINNAVSDTVIQEEGVPQGSVLSCSLFTLAINSIAECLPVDVKYSLYVDDFMIYSTSANLPSLERRIQLAVNRVRRWMMNHGFQVNLGKTFGMNFHRRHNADVPTIEYNGNIIRFPAVVKFLGLLFDSGLTWKQHIKNLKAQCISRLGLLRCLSHTDWGADREVLIRLYRAIIRSKIDYASIVYSCTSEQILQALNPVHNTALRICTGAYKSSPIVSLYAETGEPSLKYRRMQLLLQFDTHLNCHPESPTYTVIQNPVTWRKSIMQNLNDAYDKLHLQRFSVLPISVAGAMAWKMPHDTFCRELNYPRKTPLHSNILRNLFMEHQYHNHRNSTYIYTDGSKSDDGVGFSVLIDNNQPIRSKLPHVSSIFTAELMAILVALYNIAGYNNNSFSIFTDSQSAISAIEKIKQQHPIVTEVQQWIIRLHTIHKTVKICWVPSHVEVAGNERADREARNAVTQHAPVVIDHLPHRDYHGIIKCGITRNWNNEWRLTENNKLRKIKDHVYQWQSSNCENRRMERCLMRLRIGHTHLTHQYLMENTYEPYCEDCLVPLTVRHVIAECPNYRDERSISFPGTENMAEEEIMSAMLTEYNGKYDISALLQYLTNIGIYWKI